MPPLNDQSRSELRKRFVALLTGPFQIPPETAQSCATNVFAAYDEVQRHYHTLRHIQHCLWELDRLTVMDLNKPEMEMAIWYHDVVYNPKSRTNEKDSADRMLNELGTANPQLNSGMILKNIEHMILLSAHRPGDQPQNPSEAHFLDIDMSILGQEAVVYRAYQKQIRQEFSHVPIWIFVHYRKKFLKAVLKHGAFTTATYRGLYEESSRRNLRRELSQFLFRMIP